MVRYSENNAGQWNESVMQAARAMRKCGQLKEIYRQKNWVRIGERRRKVHVRGTRLVENMRKGSVQFDKDRGLSLDSEVIQQNNAGGEGWLKTCEREACDLIRIVDCPWTAK